MLLVSKFHLIRQAVFLPERETCPPPFLIHSLFCFNIRPLICTLCGRHGRCPPKTKQCCFKLILSNLNSSTWFNLGKLRLCFQTIWTIYNLLSVIFFDVVEFLHGRCFNWNMSFIVSEIWSQLGLPVGVSTRAQSPLAPCALKPSRFQTRMRTIQSWTETDMETIILNYNKLWFNLDSTADWFSLCRQRGWGQKDE